MKIYNSLSNKIETFIPINEKKVNMYICGPTVNKRAHVGNLYPAIFFDMVYRYLKYLGYEIKYVSNFTDIDDKIIEEAIKNNKTEKEIAEKYINLYLEDINKIGCLKIDERPRVTEYINDIIDFIQQLLKKNYAYKNGNDIYLDINKITNYGELSNQNIEELNYGNRIEIDKNKHNPYDFVLWKYTENGIKWEAPFGSGRPGWHTECVVMINKIFSGKIDIHGGGTDLKFPHHENEIAQSKAMWNHKLSNYWMHNGHITINGEKMSKSLGNSLTIDDLLSKYNVNTIRIAFLKNHYRSPLNINDTLFKESFNINEKIENVLKNANLYIQINKLKNEIIKNDNRLEECLNDDFNTSNLFTYLHELIKNLNVELKNNNHNNIIILYNKILLINNILGLYYYLPILNEESIEIYNKWTKLRDKKEYEKADELRKKLVERSVL